MIRVGLFGFGKTGRMVAKELLQDELIELVWVMRRKVILEEKYASRLIGINENKGIIVSKERLTHSFYDEYPVDVIIDFSDASAYKNYTIPASRGIKIISAISHYSPKVLQDIKELAHQTAIIYSPNITLGINFLMVISQILQKIAANADIEIVEEHFREKKGISGTACKMAHVLGLDEQQHVNSIRVGGIVGKHQVIFGLQNQTIRLIHESISGAAFGKGAIFASKWVVNKGKGFYSMEQIFSEMIQKNIPVY
jgi:4-hydroxy-tetrahydrodipicolinate reductase